mgnify:CR=1 FL=1
MKQLSTNTLESLLVAAKDAKSGIAMKHLERVLRRHDRKGELRAGILGIDAATFKGLQKQYGFDELIRRYGFKKQSDFCLALIGKLRSELLYRGWSRQRIDSCGDGRVAFAA